MRPRKIGRLLVPATVVTLAVAGAVLLVASESVDRSLPANAPPPSGLASRTPPPARASAKIDAPRSVAAPVSLAPPAASQPLPVVAATPSAAPGTLSLASEKPLARPRETPESLRATPYVVQLARATNLQQRLRVLDEIATRPTEQAAEAFIGLMDCEVPGGTVYEIESVRLAVLGHLGKLSSLPRAHAALVERMGPGFPRPQRLLAIELLAGGPSPPLPELETVAREDADVVVQEKARWALARCK
jgi:hypothetical protein